MEKMKWKIREGFVKDQFDNIIAILPINSEYDNEKILEVAPRAVQDIRKFVDEVNSGTLKPRSAVKDFEKILEDLE